MKRVIRQTIPVWVVLAALLLSACGSAAPTAPPTPEGHTWQAQPVLAEVYTSAGFTTREFAWSILPDFVLYSDGRLIVVRNEYTEQGLARAVLDTHLTPVEVCGLLTQIEADGFFDFDPNEYVVPQVTDLGSTLVSVNAWRSQQVSAYALDFAIGNPGEGVHVPPALAKTYQRLLNYRPAGAQPYQPETIALLISPADAAEAAIDWPLSSPALADLTAQAAPDKESIVLEGEAAQAVYGAFGGSVTQVYREDGQAYRLTVRPVLPQQVIPPQDNFSSPTFPTEPTTELTCSGSAIEQATLVPAEPTSVPTDAPAEPVTTP